MGWGDAGHHSFLDSIYYLCIARAAHIEDQVGDGMICREEWRSVCVLGLGRSGAAAAQLARSNGLAVEVFDANAGSDDLRARVATMEDIGCKVFTGARGISGTDFDAAMAEVADFMTLADLKEATNHFPHFKPF